jgi:cellulose synthase/poly-beta-1,6-N-acetylglucosamine synthase-like glycosyltransferase
VVFAEYVSGLVMLSLLIFSNVYFAFFLSFSIYDIIIKLGATLTDSLTNIIGKFGIIPLENFWIYLPISIIIAWMGVTLIFKRIYAQPYRAVEPVPYYKPSMSIITAVYNENPKIFKSALCSWQTNDPDEIIAVIDKTDKPCIDVFIEFSKDKPWAKLIVASKRGKREALVDGILESKSNIIALVDSDTIWGHSIKQKILAPFRKQEIGAVTMRINALARDSIWQKVSDIFMDIRNFSVLPSQTAMGNTLNVLSGEASLYRREILISMLNEFLNENILGRRKETGDDLFRTRLIQREGWKTYYQSNAQVYTSVPINFKTFLKQRIRWYRNTHNYNIARMLDNRTWKQPYVAFNTVDYLMITFAMVVGPILVGTAIYIGYWNIALFIVIVSIFNITIKTVPHLKSQPKDIFILPVYVIIAFLIEFMWIYALVTLREQRWIRNR